MPTFETPGPISVVVELGYGDIRVAAEERGDSEVEVRPTDPTKKGDVAAAGQTRVEYADGTLLVRAPLGWRHRTPWGGRESIDVRIAVPKDSTLQGSAGVGAVHATGRLDACRFKTGLGDIQLERAGEVSLSAGMGDVIVDAAEKKVDVKTAGAVRIGSIQGTGVIKNTNGDTWVGAVSGDLRLHAANGSISIGHADGSVVAKSSNGDVRLDEVSRGAVVAQSAMGTVEVGVREGVAAWLDLSTRFGTVSNELDDTAAPEAGEDTVEIRARTSMGDVTVHRVPAPESGR